MSKYRVVCYMRVEPEEGEPMSHEDAKKEVAHFETMQPENLYRIEEIDQEIDNVGPTNAKAS